MQDRNPTSLLARQFYYFLIAQHFGARMLCDQKIIKLTHERRRWIAVLRHVSFLEFKLQFGDV